MKHVTSALDKIADSLEKKGELKLASEVDVLSNTVEAISEDSPFAGVTLGPVKDIQDPIHLFAPKQLKAIKRGAGQFWPRLKWKQQGINPWAEFTGNAVEREEFIETVLENYGTGSDVGEDGQKATWHISQWAITPEEHDAWRKVRGI